MKHTVKIMILGVVLTGGTVFVQLAKNAFERQAKQYSVNLENSQKQKLAIAKQAEKEAQKALDAYNEEISVSDTVYVQAARKKQSFKFEQAKHTIKDVSVSDIDLASLKTEDLNIKFATQDSDVNLRLWKKNPKEFLDNRI